jgi:hypothetical protein
LDFFWTFPVFPLSHDCRTKSPFSDNKTKTFKVSNPFSDNTFDKLEFRALSKSALRFRISDLWH